MSSYSHPHAVTEVCCRHLPRPTLTAHSAAGVARGVAPERPVTANYCGAQVRTSAYRPSDSVFGECTFSRSTTLIM